MATETKTLNSQMAKGAAWMVMFKLLERSIGLISTIILARLLIPEDFGLVALALVVITFLELLRAFNFDVVLIQNPEATREHYDTAWTFNVAFAAFIALLLTLVAPSVSDFYDDQRLTNIIYVLAIAIGLSGFENIGVVAFRKELTFHKEFVYLLGKKLIGFVTVVSLAFTLKNYWALVLGTAASQVGQLVLSYLVHPYRAKFCATKLRELIGFSSWLLLSNFLIFLENRFPHVIVGKLVGTSSLGVYSIGHEIALLPTTELVAPINRAVFPGYCKLSSDLEALKKSYLDTVSLIAIFALPAAAGIAAVCPLFVPVVLGDKWLETIPVIQIVAISGALIALNTNSGAIFLALGRPRVMTAMLAVRVVILIGAFYFLTRDYGLLGSACAVLLAAAISVPIVILVTLKVLHIYVPQFVSVVYRPVISTLLMYVVVDFAVGFTGDLPTLLKQLTALCLIVILGGVTYSCVALCMWFLAGSPQGPEQLVLEQIIDKFRRVVR